MNNNNNNKETASYNRQGDMNHATAMLWLDATQVIAIPEGQQANQRNFDDLPQAYAESTSFLSNNTSVGFGQFEGEQQQQQVTVLPAYPTPDTGERDRRLARTGTHRGRQDAEGEIAEIRRHNRIIPHINANEIEKLRLANQRAVFTNILEETGQVQTSYAASSASSSNTSKNGRASSVPPRKAPDFFEGTYGKPYETSEYNTKEYDTMSYDTTEYKSVYDP